MSIAGGIWQSPEADGAMTNQLKMAGVQAILALARGGWSNRQIARQLGVHRETVGRHLRLATAGDPTPARVPTGSEGGEPAGPIGPKSGLVSSAGTWREVIVRKLDAGLTAQRIDQELCGEQGYAGSYWSVRRLVRKLHGAGTAGMLPCRRLEVEAGEEAQVDFGRGAPIRRAEGRRLTTWVFRIVLSHSLMVGRRTMRQPPVTPTMPSAPSSAPRRRPRRWRHWGTRWLRFGPR